MKIIDLSKPIKFNSDDPFFMKIKIKHKSHKKASLLLRLYGLPKHLMQDGFEGWADDVIQKMGVHAATHIDAPWHYFPTTSGAKSKTIEQIPLEYCFGNGVVIDMAHKADFEAITETDIQFFLEKNNIQLKPLDIVLIYTGRDKYNGTKDFYKKGTGMTANATKWLINKGIKLMGTDGWGWDLPLLYMIKKAKETNDKNFFWEAHLVGKDYEYYHIEQLVNLDQLPTHGFKVYAFPLPIVGASAAPARVVAVLE